MDDPPRPPLDVPALGAPPDERARWLWAAAPARLRPEQLRRCTVHPDRDAMLRVLPKQAVVAEVGVLHGDFAQGILSATEPRELHLFDVNDGWGDRFRAA